MPALVRLYVRQVLLGFGLGAVFTGLLLWLDVARLWHLVQSVPGGWLAAFLLFFFNWLVFAGVQFAIAVMGMAERPPGGGGAIRTSDRERRLRPAAVGVRR